MKTAQITEELIGRRIKSPLYSQEGHLLLTKGTVINNNILAKLERHSIKPIDILNSLSKGIKPVGIINDAQMVESIKVVKNVFKNVLYNEPNGVSAAIPPEHMALVEEVIEALIKTISKSKDLLYTVSEMLKTSEYTYKHSVNVAVLSILTAQSLGYETSDIKNIALGALLHDVGKMRVDQSIITKPSKLTDDERKEIEKHPKYGYDLLKNIKSLSFTAKQIVLFHHEKLDGTGYPFGLKGIEIPEFVRIVTICDMYDSMSTDRVYRNRMPIYTVLELLMTDSVHKLDRKVYRRMTENICLHPPGSGVVLSDGRVGVVSFYRASNPSRPHVRVIDFDSDITKLRVENINLEKRHTLFIVGAWDINEFKNAFKPNIKPQLYT